MSRSENLARGGLDLLGVNQVAALLEGGDALHRPAGRLKLDVGQELGHVARQPRELGRLGILEQVPVLLHCRAAAGRVDHDRVQATPEEGAEVLAGQLAHGAALATVDVERATAHLAAREVDLTAVVPQHAQGGGVNRPVDIRHHAAGKHANPIAGGAFSRIDLHARQERLR
jgi:hypothetical protein